MKRVLVTLALVVALSLSVVQAQEMMSPLEHIVALWNSGETESLADWVSEDVVVHLPLSLGVAPPFSGLEGYQMNVGGWRAGLPDLAVEVLAMVEDEGMAALRVMMTGTHTETFFGIPPTGAELAFTANILVEYDEDGRIVAEWWEWDTALELIQLGLFTPPAPPTG